MATRKRQNPFRGVMDVMSEMSRMSDQMYGSDSKSTETTRRGYADAWSPTTDIYASGDDVIIQAELPGVAPSEVEVTFSSGVLSIAGERRHDNDDDDFLYYVRERFSGRFRRDITLPEGVQESQIEARFEEGLVEITVRDCAAAPGPSQIELITPRGR